MGKGLNDIITDIRYRADDTWWKVEEMWLSLKRACLFFKWGLKDKDFDYGYLLLLERNKLALMADYFSTNERINQSSVNRIRLCCKLIDIYIDEEARTSKGRYVNTRNAERVWAGWKGTDFTGKDGLKDILREQKAWAIYCDIVKHRLGSWWI